MAVQAPAHLQCRGLPGQRHPCDIAVAVGAIDSIADVDRVIEIHEVRQTVDAVPLQRLCRRARCRAPARASRDS